MRLTPGTKVIFGTENGAQTQGTILKVNRVMAKVRQDEARNSRPVGTMWNVPPSLMRTTDGKFIDSDWNIVDEKPNLRKAPTGMGDPNAMPNDWWIQQYQHEIHILNDIYAGLSPENLTCDGECSASQVSHRHADLMRKKAAVETLMERRMSEDTTYRCIERLREIEAKKTSALTSTQG